MNIPLSNLYPGVSVGDPATPDLGRTLPVLNPRKHTWLFDDFHTYVAGDWTVTDTGAATQALTSGHGGRLLLTNTNGGTDLQSLQHVTTDFAPASGKKLWMEFRLQGSEITNDAIFLGLAATDTTPIASLPSDYAAFYKASGGTSFVFQTAGSSATILTVSSIKTMVAATDFTLGFYYDGGSNYEVYADGVTVGSGSLAFASILPTANMRPTIAHQAAAAAAYTMNIDYYLIAMDR